MKTSIIRSLLAPLSKGSHRPTFPTLPVPSPRRPRNLHPWLAGGLALFLLTGCLPSLYPLYTEKDVIYDSALLGTWKEKAQSQDSWTFSQRQSASGGREVLVGEGKIYDLVIRDEGKASPFLARLLTVQGLKFLDLQPTKEGLESLEREIIYKSVLVRAHVFLKVRQIEPILEMQLLDLDWLGKLLEKDPGALRHYRDDNDTFVLTATTTELQDFVLKYANNEQAWSDLSQLEKFPETK